MSNATNIKENRKGHRAVKPQNVGTYIVFVYKNKNILHIETCD